MKSVTLAPPQSVGIAVRLLDFAALTKPRIALLVLFTVAIGAVLASSGAVDFLLLVNTLVGTGLVAGGASRTEPTGCSNAIATL